MNAGTKLAALNKFRSPSGIMRQPITKILVIYDVQVKTPEVSQVPLVINYGRNIVERVKCSNLSSLVVPRFAQSCRRICASVRCKEHLLTFLTLLFSSVAPAIAPSYSRAGVVVNFVTATGGDVEMLRSIECFYK